MDIQSHQDHESNATKPKPSTESLKLVKQFLFFNVGPLKEDIIESRPHVGFDPRF